jgi:putative CocE/NonD family hydrolase
MSLHLDDPGADEAALDYISDPARPVPYHPRPIHYDDDDDNNFWHDWLADDQREASTRTDVLTLETAPLQKPIKIAGEPVADLLAATTGSDGDFVVKLIDVYPDEVPITPTMSGYQLMVSADILRGRYRESLSDPKAITSGARLRYRFSLPTANHVFLPGHRIMVQVQSSWFPLYDRNPQTYVENIFNAVPGDYHKATISVVAGGAQGSFVSLPVVEGK